MKLLVCVVLLLLVGGCNSVDQKAVSSYLDAGNASIQGSASYKGSGLFPRKQMYWVAQIDNAAAKSPSHAHAYALAPGMRTIVAGGGLFQGHLGSHDTLGGQAEFSLEAKVGHKYEVRGDVFGEQLSIYIFDLTTGAAATPTKQPATLAQKHTDPLLILVPLP